MKIEQIILENFGMYARKTFRFDAAPLVLIYGPNESGKTTALNGIRQALCGFRPRTPYLLAGRPMSAELTARLSDGRQLQFLRRKGRQDEITGSIDARRLQLEELQKLIDGFDLESYEQLFGFSLDELRKGEAALKNSRLSDALAGGGLGGMAALQQLRKQLEDSLSSLYKPRGSTSQINLKLAEIEKSYEALRQTQTLPSAIEDLQSQLQNEIGRSDELRQATIRDFSRRSLAKRLLEALPKHRELQRVTQLLATIDLPHGIDLAFVAQWSENARQREEFDNKLKQLNNSIERDQQQLLHLGAGGKLLDFEQEIDRLGHQADRIRASRLRLKELEEQVLDNSSICKRLLETIDLPEINERLRSFALSATARRELESLSAKSVAIEAEVFKLNAKLDACEESLNAYEVASIINDVPEDLTPLFGSVQRLQKTKNELENKSSLYQELIEDNAYVQLTSRLLQVSAELEQLDPQWRVPSQDCVSEHRLQYDSLEREQASLDDRILSIQGEMGAAESALQLFQTTNSAMARMEQLNEINRRRDELILSWLDELAEPLIAASVTPNLQLSRLQLLQEYHSAAEQIQRSMIADADSLASMNQKREYVHGLNKELQSLQEQRQTVVRRTSEHTVNWSAIWQECPFEPKSPSVMSVWLADYQMWCTATRRIEHSRRELHILREQERMQWKQLQDIWPENLKQDCDTSFLEASLTQWEATRRDAARDDNRRKAARASVQSLQAQLQVLQQEQQCVMQRFEAWLRQSPVSDWPIEQITTLLDTIERLRREDLSMQRAQQSICELRELLATFINAVLKLGDSLGCRVEPDNAEIEASGWLDQLQSIRVQQKQRIQLNASIQHQSQLAAEITSQLQKLDSKLASLCAAAADSDLLTMSALMERVRKAEELKTQQNELSASLDAYASLESNSDFRKLLEESQEASLQLEIRELDRRLNQQDSEREQTDQNIGGLTQRIEQLANNQAAQGHLTQLHGRRCELAELAEQWVVERLAQELLSRSIERFAADNEPALLQLSRKFLSKLTGGKYTSIDRDNTDSGLFIVRNAQAEGFEPSRLSTGTREQLYLAIRMAYITHHCEQHEPLPVIMDDCFVNFDDARTRLALEAIADWDDSMQTIVLSCHWRVVQMLSEVAPQTPVIHMESDLCTTAAELASQFAIP